VHHAIGARHLARQRHHRDGEGDAGIGFAVDEEMADHRAHHRADGAADKKAGGGTTDFTPDRHLTYAALTARGL
jgi:hypothetical protein